MPRHSLRTALCIGLAVAAGGGGVATGADVPPARGYEAGARRLEALIAREAADKGLPALSIALVDGRAVVWARGFGHADREAKIPATADTVYRVGPVSGLFTGLAVMQLAERGALDLDGPVTKYLPDFKPVSRFDGPVTLRQLMSHRAGLVREPPEGGPFDPSAPSLARTVAGLNRTELVHAPGSAEKYSDAGVATAGFVLEETQKQPFPRYLARTLLVPLGMGHSTFAPDPALAKDTARGVMGTYHGREFPAPTFEPGTVPAVGMYSSANDLARFLAVLLAGGKGDDGALVAPETLEAMWKPVGVAGKETGFGIGFRVETFEGRRRVGRGGSCLGFSAVLAALPDDRLGVVVLTSRDGAGGVTSHVADEALRQMLAVRARRRAPPVEETTALRPEVARRLAGRYRCGGETLDLEERGGRLWVVPGRGGLRVELRARGKALVVDDRLAYGETFEPLADGKLRFGGDTYERVSVAEPSPPPARWSGLIGEYGTDHGTLFVLEKDGKLHVLIGWYDLCPLREESADVYRFSDRGPYPGEKVVFTRDGSGRATRAEAAGMIFERRKVDGENGETFRIKAQRPLVELRREAAAATLPVEKGDFRKPELVDLTALDPTIKLDVRYATDNNFLSTPFYTSAKAFMQKPAAEALARVHKKLAERGYGLLIHDAYRPWAVTKMFWEATPEKQRVFVADPAKGSRHNRGCAVDLTLYVRKTGKPVEMVGGYDEFSDRSYPDYPGGTSRQRWHRELLRRSMEAEGFTVYEAEWWHFDYQDWRKYPILNKTFEEIAAKR